MSNKRLELTWIGKDNRPRLEPRILLEDPALSYHATERVTDKDIFDNRLILGDNLLALKALERELVNQVRCVYIDPPFNTDEDRKYYPDGLEHSCWLTMMRDRLEIIHRLLTPGGSCFIHIDDNELGYLIAVADEIFRRENRIAVITFKQSSASGPKSVNPGVVSTSNFLLYYAKDKKQWQPSKVYARGQRDDRYSKFISNFEGGPEHWSLISVREAFSRTLGVPAKDVKALLGESYEDRLEQFVLDNATKVVRTARVAAKDVNAEARESLSKSQQQPGRVWFSERPGKSTYYFLNGEQLVFYSAKAREIDGEVVTTAPLTTIWDDLLSNNLHNEGGVDFPDGKKPEALIKRILELSTREGDLVLDSFAGSGTTAATAHKMRRRWITIEQESHARTHVAARLRAVIDGVDGSGITKAVAWKRGGGFRFYTLAPSLLRRDQYGQWVINESYKAEMLAEAMCKHMGFAYEPSKDTYWIHGRSTETDFIFVTTQTLSHEALGHLSEEVGDIRTLLVCCSAWTGNASSFENLTLQKIPNAILHKCEFGHDDYSLTVQNLPMQTAEPPDVAPPRNQRSRTNGSLFDDPEAGVQS
jgi:adenine-specific DNA-methyltransferase